MTIIVESTEEATLDILKEYGMNIDRIKKEISLSQFMAWEQVLLLSIYSRSLLLDKDGLHFYGRMQMVGTTLRISGETGVRNEVLRRLDLGCGISDIFDYVKTDNIKQSEEYGPPESDKCTLVREIENERIAFSKLHKPYLYPHYAMYQALKNPIKIFQDLLNMRSTKLLILDEIYSVLRSKLKERKPNKLLEAPRSPSNVDIREFLKNLQDDSEDSVKELLNLIEQGVYKRVYDSINMIFSGLSMHEEHTDRNQCELQKDFCTSDLIEGAITIKLDKIKVEKLSHLGGFNRIIDSVKDAILAEIDPNSQKTIATVTNAKELTLGKWYAEVKTELIKTEKQIPGLIASIIDFDIQNQLDISFFGPYRAALNRNMSTTVSGLLSSKFIEHCLYKAGKLGDFKIELHVKYDPKTFCASNTDEKEVRNELLKEWAEFGPKEVKGKQKSSAERLKERFRGPRKKIHTLFFDIERMIKQQKSNAMQASFPNDPSCPLPIWSVY